METIQILEQATQITDQATKYSDIIMTQVLLYGPRVILAIIVLFVGFNIIRLINRIILKGLHTANVDQGLHRFIKNFISTLFKIMLIISVAGMVGIETASFVAIIGAAGLAIGLALQGSLSNFAAGVIILLFKPYKVGDFGEFNGEKGTVDLIDIFTTQIISPSNTRIIISNGSIISHNITNYTTQYSARVDVTVGIAYDADLTLAKSVLKQLLDDEELFITDHIGTGVYVNELADSSVNLIVRGYTDSSNYRNAYYSLTEQIKLTLDKYNIEIPFPQRVIHTTK